MTTKANSGRSSNGRDCRSVRGEGESDVVLREERLGEPGEDASAGEGDGLLRCSIKRIIDQGTRKILPAKLVLLSIALRWRRTATKGTCFGPSPHGPASLLNLASRKCPMGEQIGLTQSACHTSPLSCSPGTHQPMPHHLRLLLLWQHKHPTTPASHRKVAQELILIILTTNGIVLTGCRSGHRGSLLIIALCADKEKLLCFARVSSNLTPVVSFFFSFFLIFTHPGVGPNFCDTEQ